MYGNVIFVVWRESVEALLVVGILNAWLAVNAPEARRARVFLWSGALAGLVVAGALGGTFVALSDVLSDTALGIFRTAMVLVAAGLILQMVVWMRRHGRTMKRDLEGALGEAVTTENWWGVFTLALIALTREGSETVVFLYGILSADLGDGRVPAIGAGSLGLLAAFATYALLQLGSHRLSWKVFFRVTESMLLLLACALVVSGVDGLIDLDVLPALSRRLWDSSWLLSDGGAIGGLVAGLTGYRARPVLTEFLAFLAYWSFVLWLIARPLQQRTVAA
ncbi:FTR1 family protein [Azospirillum sp. 11R-A]|uniref:FTR1 family iron permease n=1 Tax=Azospirillum sp. 11R-A TaxID=3111634 RepID=UPI003C1EBF0A